MPEPIRTLIVDDEPPARQLLTWLLAEDEAFTVVGECGSGEEAVDAIRRLAPALLLLDVEMPDLTGFEVLRRLGSSTPPYVVFVTAWDRYAVEAFRVHALDYLLKPIEADRFSACTERVKARLRQRGLCDLAERVLSCARTQAEAVGEITAGAGRRLTLRARGRLKSLEVADIVWVEAADQYVVLHTDGGSHLLSRSLAALERELPADEFVRIHRSALVNLRFLREVRSARYGAHWIFLSTGERLRLSRGRRELLPRLLAAADA